MPVTVYYIRRSGNAISGGAGSRGQLGSLGGRHLSMSERLSLLRQAGWPDVMVTDSDGAQNPLLVIMLAISEKESNGYACAHSEDPSVEDSWCWLQVNRAAHSEYSSTQLCDPLTCAKAALKIYQAAGSLDPWGPWQTGIYAEAMPQAWIAYQGGGGVAAATAAGNTNSSNTTLIAGLSTAGLLAVGLFAYAILSD